MAYWAMMSLRHSAVRKVDTVFRIRAGGFCVGAGGIGVDIELAAGGELGGEEGWVDGVLRHDELAPFGGKEDGHCA